MTRLAIAFAIWVVGVTLLLRGALKVRQVRMHRGAIEMVAGGVTLAVSIWVGSSALGSAQ